MLQKKKLWRALSLASIFLLVFSLTAGNIAGAYEAMVNQALHIETSKVVGGEGPAVYYTSDYSSLEELYQAKVALLRDIADEGVVLLKNKDGALPVSDGKITILGESNLLYSTEMGGGSITADMQARSTTLSQAFALNGLAVNTDERHAAGSELVLVVIGRVSGEGNDAALGSLALTDADRALISSAKASGGKVAVLLSGDHPIEAAELARDDGVDAILQLGNAGYRGAWGVADVVTGRVNPSGRLVETYAVDSMSAPAMMNFGNYSFTNGSKIKASQAKNYVVYNEGIYVDYRYYETRYEDCVLDAGSANSTAGTYAGNGGWSYAQEVLYPFGYGLSYTSFDKEIVGEPVFDDGNHIATITVKVTNTGSVSGKEVVQLYAQAPYTQYDIDNRVEKAAVQLMGFEKTEELAPGASATVEITVHLQWLASYDYAKAKTYIMDAGDYYFAVGDSAHDALNNILAAKDKTTADGMTENGDSALTRTWHQDALDQTTYAQSLYVPGTTVTNAFDDADINYWVPGTLIYLSRSNWQGTYPETQQMEASADMISALNDTKRYENGVWNDEIQRAANENVAYQDLTTLEAVNQFLTSGGVTASAVSMRGKDYNDAGWKNILDSLSIYEMSRLVAQGRGYVQACPSVAFPESSGLDGPNGLGIPYLYESINSLTGEKTPLPADYTISDPFTQESVAADDTLYANMYASEPVLGATFNKSLAARQGDMWGEDGLYCNASFIYAPGSNLHRVPYGGRSSEYVSADPVHSALMLAELTKTANAKGQVTVAKHFVINEQEQNRIGVGTFINEQALRELYLRAFEGVMTYGEARGVMSSYNRIGVISTSAEYDLLTTVLRNEWGSQAYVVTDLGSPTAGLYDGNASIVAGVSSMLNNGVYDDPTKAYVNQTLSVESIKSDPVLLTATREACHRILFNFIHSNAVNGISADASITFVTPWWKTLFTVLDVIFAIGAVGSTALYIISANKKEDE